MDNYSISFLNYAFLLRTLFLNTGYFAEVACRWDKPDVVAYAVQVHTHHVGK